MTKDFNWRCKTCAMELYPLKPEKGDPEPPRCCCKHDREADLWDIGSESPDDVLMVAGESLCQR